MPKPIAKNSRYILTTEPTLALYERNSLSLINELPVEPLKAYFLHEEYLFVSYSSGDFEALSIPDFQKVEIALNTKSKVLSIFAKDSMLYCGCENGLISVFVFSKGVFKATKEYKHSAPVTSIASDNISLFVSDMRNKVTEYPSGISYDFENPVLTYKGYVFCFDKNRIFTRTKEAFGMFFEAEENIEDLFFSDRGGYFFIRDRKSTKCYNTSTLIFYKEFFIDDSLTDGERLLSFKSDNIDVFDLFITDNEPDLISFRDVSIKQKKVSPSERETRYTYIDDGNKKYINTRTDSEKNHRGSAETGKILHNTRADSEKNTPITAKIAADRNLKKENSSNIIEGDAVIKRKNGHQSAELKKLFSESEDEESNGTPKTQEYLYRPSSIRATPLIFTSGSFQNSEAHMMCYNSEGYMMSVESPLSNIITIKYHDNSTMPIEIKDKKKSKIGAFCQENFVLSDGSFVNFSDRWEKEIKANLIGISCENVFVLSDLLTIFNHKGEILHEIFVPEYYTFCCSNGKIAIFMAGQVLIIESSDRFTNDLNASYVPIKNVEFCCFCDDLLFVKSSNIIFTLTKNLFIKVMEISGRVVNVFNGYVATLRESPILLPRPSIDFNEIKIKNKIKKEKEQVLSIERYNPLKH